LYLIPQAWLGLIIGQGVMSARRLRARSGLSPQLREITRRQQRQAAGTRLFLAFAAALIMGVIWLIAQLWFLAGMALVFSLGCLVLWRWWAPAQGRRWAAALGRALRARRS
jgi:Flp pilus assembly protein TadB